MSWRAALVLAILAIGSPAGAETRWNVVPSRSAVALSASQLFVARIDARLPVASGTIVTGNDPALPIEVELTFDSADLHTGNAQRDGELRGPHFFDVQHNRRIVFTAGRISAAGQNAFAIEGMLTMRGITRPLHLDGRMAGASAAGAERSVRYVAQGRFRRSDYGMTSMRGIIGNTVTLQVTIEARS